MILLVSLLLFVGMTTNAFYISESQEQRWTSVKCYLTLSSQGFDWAFSLVNKTKCPSLLLKGLTDTESLDSEEDMRIKRTGDEDHGPITEIDDDDGRSNETKSEIVLTLKRKHNPREKQRFIRQKIAAELSNFERRFKRSPLPDPHYYAHHYNHGYHHGFKDGFHYSG